MIRSKILILLAVLLGLCIGGILLLSKDKEQFRLIENIESVPLQPLQSDAPGWIPPQTLRAAPDSLRLDAKPGEELQPLQITSTFDIPLQLAVSFQSQQGNLLFSRRSWVQPPESIQEIGMLIPEDAEGDIAGLISVRAKLPQSAAEPVRGRQVTFLPRLELQVPVFLGLPGPAARAWDIGAPEIKSDGQVSVQISNSSEEILFPRGKFTLRSESGPAQTVPLNWNEALVGLDEIDIRGAAPLTLPPDGSYTLEARVSADDASKTSRSYLDIRDGKIIYRKRSSASLRLAPSQSGVLVRVTNLGAEPLSSTLLLRAGRWQKRIPLTLGPQTVWQEKVDVPLAAGEVQAEIRDDALPIASGKLLLEPEQDPSSPWPIILLAVVAGAALFWIAKRARGRSSAKSSGTRKPPGKKPAAKRAASAAGHRQVPRAPRASSRKGRASSRSARGRRSGRRRDYRGRAPRARQRLIPRYQDWQKER